jgi:hypothetical protein
LKTTRERSSSLTTTWIQAKYIDIKHHYIGEVANARTVAVQSVGTADMLEDGLTKALPEPKHTMTFKRYMGAAPSGDYFV